MAKEEYLDENYDLHAVCEQKSLSERIELLCTFVYDIKKNYSELIDELKILNYEVDIIKQNTRNIKAVTSKIFPKEEE